MRTYANNPHMRYWRWLKKEYPSEAKLIEAIPGIENTLLAELKVHSLNNPALWTQFQALPKPPRKTKSPDEPPELTPEYIAQRRKERKAWHKVNIVNVHARVLAWRKNGTSTPGS